MSHDLATRFRDSMRRTASGVAVIATDGTSGRAGVTVSTLCSLSMEPPSVIACVNRDSRSLDALLANAVFCANVLADDQEVTAKAFAGLIPELRDDKFASGTWRTLLTGSPVLDGCVACFDCRIAATYEFGTHQIVVGEVLEVLGRAAEPLVFADRDFRRLAA